MGALKLHVTATAVPLGPVAVNEWDAPRARTAEVGEMVTLDAGGGLTGAALEVPPPPDPGITAGIAAAQISDFVAGKNPGTDRGRRAGGETMLESIVGKVRSSRLPRAEVSSAKRPS